MERYWMPIMADHHILRAKKLEKEAEKKLRQFDDAAQLLEQAADSYRLVNSLEEAADTYIKVADCHLKTGRKHEAARVYRKTAQLYEHRKNFETAVEFYEKEAETLEDEEVPVSAYVCKKASYSHADAARCCMKIAEGYEEDDDRIENLVNAVEFFEKAAQLFQDGQKPVLSSQCSLKAAYCCENLARSYRKDGEVFENHKNFEDATKRFEKAAVLFDKAVEFFEKEGRQESKSVQKAANSYVDLAACYRKVAELRHEKDGKNSEKAIGSLEKAAELFENGEVPISAVECNHKAAQLAAHVKQYSKAVEIYEKIVSQSLNHSKLKHRAKTYLFEAGIWRLCRGDGVLTITRALEGLDPAFSGTWECNFLKKVGASMEEEDLDELRDKGFDKILDSWKNTLLKRVEPKKEIVKEVPESTVQEKKEVPKSVRTRRSTLSSNGTSLMASVY